MLFITLCYIIFSNAKPNELNKCITRATGVECIHAIKSINQSINQSINLKTDLAADHAAEAGTAGPATADLALHEQVAVFIADSDATASVVALVVCVGRARKPSRRGAGGGIGKVNGLHLSEKVEWGVKGGYEMCLENIFISYSFKILFSVCVVYHQRTNIVPS